MNIRNCEKLTLENVRDFEVRKTLVWRFQVAELWHYGFFFSKNGIRYQMQREYNFHGTGIIMASKNIEFLKKIYLNSAFEKIKLHCQSFSHEDIRIMAGLNFVISVLSYDLQWLLRTHFPTLLVASLWNSSSFGVALRLINRVRRPFRCLKTRYDWSY